MVLKELDAGITLLARAAKNPTPPIPLLRKAQEHFQVARSALLPQLDDPITIRIFGSGDDLVEVEGDIIEEFVYRPDGGEPGFIGFSDGTIITIEWTKAGIWRINKLRSGLASYEKTEGTDPETDRSDVVTMTGTIRWVVFGVAILK